MRFLMSVACVVVATGLACHGVFKDDEAAAVLKAGGEAPPQAVVDRVIREWPYSQAAVQARQIQVARWKALPPAGDGVSGGEFAALLASRFQDGFSDKLPFLDPFASGGVAYLALILALFLPKTRFRGLTLLLILGALLTMGPAFMEPSEQVRMLGHVPPYEHVLPEFPRIAAGLLFLAGLVLGPRVAPKPRPA